MFRPLLRFLPTIDVRSEFGRLGALLLTAAIRIFELLAFLLVAVGLFFAIYDGHQAARYAFWCVLSIIYPGSACVGRIACIAGAEPARFAIAGA